LAVLLIYRRGRREVTALTGKGGILSIAHRKHNNVGGGEGRGEEAALGQTMGRKGGVSVRGKGEKGKPPYVRPTKDFFSLTWGRKRDSVKP